MDNFPDGYFDSSSQNSCMPLCNIHGNNCYTMDELNNNLPVFTIRFNTADTYIDVTINAVPGYIYVVDGVDNITGNIIPYICNALNDGGSPFTSRNIIGLPFLGQFEQTYDRNNNIIGFNSIMYPSIQRGLVPEITSWSQPSYNVSAPPPTTAQPSVINTSNTTNTTVVSNEFHSHAHTISVHSSIIIASTTLIYLLI